MLDRPSQPLRSHHRMPLKLLLKRVRLTQSAAARLFGVAIVSVWRWGNGRRETPAAIRIALYLMQKHGEKPAALYTELQVKGIV